MSDPISMVFYKTKLCGSADSDSAVTAVYKGTPKNGSPALLRSYDSRKEPPPEFNCTIWQAGRATCATGLAFKPIQIGQHVFIDEGAGTYNPAPQILDEAAVNEWPGREIGVFVSIGTGKRPPGTDDNHHEWWEDFFGDALGHFAEARRRLIAKIEGCEEIHQYMLREHLAKRNVNKDNYYRLNVEVGVGEFGMNEWNRLADISTNTRRYLARPEVQKMNHDAAVKLAKIHRAHRRLQAHAAAVNLPEDEEKPLPPPPEPVSFPPIPNVVELPAEVPEEYLHRPHHPPSPRPENQFSSSQDKFTVVAPDGYPPQSEDTHPHHPPRRSANNTPPGRRSGSDVASYRQSHEFSRSSSSRPSSQQQSSPRLSTETFGSTVPPPVPPKTPIPYPDDNTNGGGITMPLPPRHVHSGSISNGSLMPPYPMDGPPPAVNKLRKPTYNVG